MGFKWAMILIIKKKKMGHDIDFPFKYNSARNIYQIERIGQATSLC